jgi:hypothetical protein
MMAGEEEEKWRYCLSIVFRNCAMPGPGNKKNGNVESSKATAATTTTVTTTPLEHSVK